MTYITIIKRTKKSGVRMRGERRRLFELHHGICIYCRRQTEMPSLIRPNHALTATVDHVIPLSRGGAQKGENATLACLRCNNLKGDMMPEEWSAYMSENPAWWELTRFERPLSSRQNCAPLPMEHSLYILKHGKKAYRRWKTDGFPSYRALRQDEPIPQEFEDPKQQAAFEAYAKKYRHVLRVQDDTGRSIP